MLTYVTREFFGEILGADESLRVLMSHWMRANQFVDLIQPRRIRGCNDRDIRVTCPRSLYCVGGGCSRCRRSCDLLSRWLGLGRYNLGGVAVFAFVQDTAVCNDEFWSRACSH